MSMMIQKFFQQFYENTSQGSIEIRTLPNGKQKFFNLTDLTELENYCEKARNSQNVFFGIGTRKDGNGSKEGILEINALWTDVDFKNIPQDIFEKQLMDFPFKPSVIISSGGGRHLYWLFKEPESDNLPDIEGYLKGLVHRLGGDPASAEIARILRVPYTLNHKYTPPRKVELVELNSCRYLLGDFDDFYIDTFGGNGNQKEVSSEINKDGIQRVLDNCRFIAWCRDNPQDVPEPLWYCMVSNLARFKGGSDIIHEYSRGYAKYSEKETNEKIRHAIRDTNPHLCKKIQEYGFNNCPNDCNVKAPAALSFKLPIVSLTELKQITAKYLLLKDNAVIDVILASVVANLLDGADPLWMLIIAPPSSAKTELLRALESCKNVRLISSLTPNITSFYTTAHLLGNNHQKPVLVEQSQYYED